jgi:hypothetical protein
MLFHRHLGLLRGRSPNVGRLALLRRASIAMLAQRMIRGASASADAVEAILDIDFTDAALYTLDGTRVLSLASAVPEEGFLLEENFADTVFFDGSRCYFDNSSPGNGSLGETGFVNPTPGGSVSVLIVAQYDGGDNGG